jgi:hypothetical protein
VIHQDACSSSDSNLKGGTLTHLQIGLMHLILHLLLNVLEVKTFVHIDHTDKAAQWYEFLHVSTYNHERLFCRKSNKEFVMLKRN